MPVPRRALLSVSDKTGLPEFGAGLVRLGFELVSTGGTARALRDGRAAGHGRGRGHRLPGDARRARQDAPPAGPRRDPGRPAAGRPIASSWPPRRSTRSIWSSSTSIRSPRRPRSPGISFDDLVEEIDIGGPSMVRAAAKNHASVAIVTSPARYAAVLAELEANGRVGEGLRSALAVEAFRHTGAYDARIAAELPGRMAAAGVQLPDEPGLPGLGRPVPADARRRPGEGRDAALRREPAPAGRSLPPPRDERSGPGRSPWAARSCRARPSATTTSWTRRAPTPSPASCVARPASSSSTPTRAARPNGRRSPKRGRTPWPAIPSPPTAASWR